MDTYSDDFPEPHPDCRAPHRNANEYAGSTHACPGNGHCPPGANNPTDEHPNIGSDIDRNPVRLGDSDYEAALW